MARTTTTLVQGLLRSAANGGDYDGSTDLTPYVNAANLIMNRVVTCATNKGITLTSDEAEMIERYLAAHCYGMADQPYASQSMGGASASYQGRTDLGIDGTKYGQVAQSLDPSGCLKAIAKGYQTMFFWGGKTPTDRRASRIE